MPYDNTNSGALFTNENKNKDSHPDYKGSININGVDYWLSAWIKTPRDRNKEDFLSLSVTPKDNNRQQTRSTNTSSNDRDARDFLSRNQSKIDAHRPAPQPQAPAPDYDSFDEDIPF